MVQAATSGLSLLPEGGAARRVGETQGVAPRFAPFLGGTTWLK